MLRNRVRINTLKLVDLRTDFVQNTVKLVIMLILTNATKTPKQTTKCIILASVAYIVYIALCHRTILS